MTKRWIAGVLLASLQAGACTGSDAVESQVVVAGVALESTSISENPLTAGHTQRIAVTLRSGTGHSSLLVEIGVYDRASQLVATKAFESVEIAAGGSVTLPFDFASPSSMAEGSYEIRIGVRDASRSTLLDATVKTFDVVSAGDSSAAPSTTPPRASAGAVAAALPARVVGGYLTTWDVRNGVTLRSIVDNTSYNLVYVAFATGTSASSGSLKLDLPPGATSAADFKSQVAYARSKGRKVIVSVGGYYDLGGFSSGYVLDSTAKVDQLMASMRTLRDDWGFDGMDWDLEHGERADVAGIVDASRRMKAEFGSSWIIAAAPGANVQSWVGPNGVFDQLGPNGWDAVGEQIYDWGIAESAYATLIVDRMTALSNKYGVDKVILGNAYKTDTASSSVADAQNRWVDIATTKGALAALRAKGINIRGAFTWTIQADSDTGYLWQATSGVGGDVLSHP